MPRSATQPPRYLHELDVLDTVTGSVIHTIAGVSPTARPTFSPDGKSMAYLAPEEQSGARNLWTLDLNSGEQHALTRFAGGVSELAWGAHSLDLLVIARSAPASADSPIDGVRVVERAHYKLDGLGFRPSTVAQLYRVPTDSTGDQPRVTARFDSEPSGLIMSSDGRSAYVTVSTSEHDDDRWLRTIAHLDLASGALTPLLKRPTTAHSLSISPDGTRIAFLAAPDPANFANLDGLWVLDLASGVTELVSEAFNGSYSIRGDGRLGRHQNGPIWLDSDTLLVNRNTAVGGSGLHTVSLSSGASEFLHPDDMVVTTFHHQAGVTTYIAERTELPGELFLVDEKGTRRLTSLNDSWLEEYNLVRERGPFEYGTGESYGRSFWYLEGTEKRADDAVVLQVHAGAQTVFGLGFFLEFQVLASLGYRVLYGNPANTGSPKNSVPMGPAHGAAMLARYTVDYPTDTLEMLDAALLAWGTLDAPVHVTGGSNGGYMTNWLVATTDRFTSAAADRSITNLLSEFGASDIGFNYVPLEHGGNPWADHEALWQQSPLKHAANVRTPVLILHAEEDHRCPISQAEEWYTALKHFGNVDVRFVRFANESHDMSRSGRPDRRIRRIAEIVHWFELHSSNHRDSGSE